MVQRMVKRIETSTRKKLLFRFTLTVFLPYFLFCVKK